jgi:glycosyltransferase involved in cell wall biosynthesis
VSRIDAVDPAPVDARIRVLWLIKGLGPGGAERLLVSQAGAADLDEFAVSAAYLVPWKDHLVGELGALGVDAVCLDGERELDPRWAWRLRALVRERQIDVVHVHSPYVAAVTRLALRTLPRRHRPALVATEHNRWPRHAPATRLANRLTIGLDDADLAVSGDVRATMSPKVRERVEVVVHGVDLDGVRAQAAERDAVRAELGIGPDEIVIGTVANFRAEKGYDVLVDAAADAVARDARLRFVAVGQGPLEDEVRRRHREAGLGDRFLLTGYRDDAVRVMAAFDIFTLASRHEGLPVSLMDALALGLPVVATRVGGIPEAVDDGVEGLLVPSDDPAALADAYLALGTDDRRRRAMGAAAATRGSDFDIVVAARRIEDIYREVVAGRSRRS